MALAASQTTTQTLLGSSMQPLAHHIWSNIQFGNGGTVRAHQWWHGHHSKLPKRPTVEGSVLSQRWGDGPGYYKSYAQVQQAEIAWTQTFGSFGMSSAHHQGRRGLDTIAVSKFQKGRQRGHGEQTMRGWPETLIFVPKTKNHIFNLKWTELHSSGAGKPLSTLTAINYGIH